MSHSSVRNTLNRELDKYAALNNIQVDWENLTTKRLDTFPRLEVYLIPALNASVTLDGDLEEIVGLYQVTVITARGGATGTGDKIIADLSKLFPSFKLYKEVSDDGVESGFSFQTTTPLCQAQGKSEGDTWRVPCWLNYKAVTNTK